MHHALTSSPGVIARVRFELDAKTVRDPIDEREVADDGARVMNGAIVVARGAKLIDVCVRDRLRRQRQHICIGQQRLLAAGQVRRCQWRGL